MEVVEEIINSNNIGSEKNNDSDNNNNNLNDDLKRWFLKHRPTRDCAIDLVRILKKKNLDVAPFYTYTSPKKAEITKIDGGLYLHIGIQNQIIKLLTSIICNENIIIDINIDGIPLFNSSNSQLWRHA